NPNSRRVWANQADSDGVLKERDGVFTGALPQGVPVANTAVDWAGRRWSMVVLPLPEDRVARRVLLAHESWHRIQDELGFAASSLTCSHLDTERGRTLLRLEMRALAQALRSEGDSRWRAARDALLFREQRHREFGDAAQTETALDRNEGNTRVCDWARARPPSAMLPPSSIASTVPRATCALMPMPRALHTGSCSISCDRAGARFRWGLHRQRCSRQSSESTISSPKQSSPPLPRATTALSFKPRRRSVPSASAFAPPSSRSASPRLRGSSYRC